MAENPQNSATNAANASKFVKRPIVIEAMRWLGRPPVYASSEHVASVDDLQAWGARIEPTESWGLSGYPDEWTLKIYVAPEQDWIRCPVGFWIIKGVKGEFYPCDPEVFEATYEPVTLTEAAVVYRDRAALRHIVAQVERIGSVLARALVFFKLRDEMNAQIHEGAVRYSPLTGSVAAAVEYTQRLQALVDHEKEP